MASANICSARSIRVFSRLAQHSRSFSRFSSNSCRNFASSFARSISRACASSLRRASVSLLFLSSFQCIFSHFVHSTFELSFCLSNRLARALLHLSHFVFALLLVPVSVVASSRSRAYASMRASSSALSRSLPSASRRRDSRFEISQNGAFCRAPIARGSDTRTLSRARFLNARFFFEEVKRRRRRLISSLYVVVDFFVVRRSSSSSSSRFLPRCFVWCWIFDPLDVDFGGRFEDDDAFDILLSSALRGKTGRTRRRRRRKMWRHQR